MKMAFEEETHQQQDDEITRLQKQKENDQFQRELDVIITRLENEQFQKELDEIIERLEQKAQEHPSTKEEISLDESVTEKERELPNPLEILSQSSEDQLILQKEHEKEQQTQNQDLTKSEDTKRNQEGELRHELDVLTECHDQHFSKYEENTEGQVTEDQVSQRMQRQKYEKTVEDLREGVEITSQQQSLTEKEPTPYKDVQSIFHEEKTEKELYRIKEESGLPLQRTLLRKRSYCIDFGPTMIPRVEKFGFTQSTPITVTVHDRDSNKSESYIRRMGKITGKKPNRSMTFALGSDIGDLYKFDTKQKVLAKVMKNKMEITLEKENYNYRFIITPGIDQNQKYSILRAYTQVSDYINTFSTKEIPVLERFGFKPSNNVLFNVYQKTSHKFLEQSVIRLGESRKVGQKSYQLKLGLPQTTLKRFNFGNSRLIKFTITPNKMVLTQVKKDDPLKERQEYNYYFTITPFKEKKIGITQRGLERINYYYAAYIGYEFERLGQEILSYLFPKAQIYRQREHLVKIKGKEKTIRPDATLLEHGKPMTFIDFKKSIGAIRPRTLNYLRYFPKSRLIIGVLEEFGHSWGKKHIKNKLNKMGLNQTEKKEIMTRITVLHKSDIASRLPKERKREFETKIMEIQNELPKDRLDALKKAKKLTTKIIDRLSGLGLPQETIGKVNKPTRGILRSLQSLLILERLLSSDYETVKSLADHDELKDKRMVQLRLRQLERIGIVRERYFRVGLSNRYYYYYFEKKPPELTDILEPQAVNGLKILMKNNYIPRKEVNDKVLQRIIGPHWLTALKISSIINEKKIITMEDLASEDNIKIESHHQVLYSLKKIGVVNYYRIFREFNDHKVVYFFTHDFPNGLTLLDQIKYLKPYQKTILNEFQRNNIIIPELNSFNEWLGDHWPVVLRVYNVLLTNENLPQSNGTKILHLYDLVQRMKDCSFGIRNALNKLDEIGVLDRYSWFEKSFYFQFKGTIPVPLTDNPLLPIDIKKPLKAIEEITNIHFQDLTHLREIMTRHWKNSLRIYKILSKIETSYSKGISRDNLIKTLKHNNIILKNLTRYIKPLKDMGVLFTYRNGQQMFYQLRY